MTPDISVVIPVYNAEKYLDKCVDSLLNQTHKNIEIIFVDDGSTDNSVQILQEYQARDNRIKILHQQNQCAGVARNNGMDAATGKYLMFLDADDFFKQNMLADLYRAAEKNQAEIVAFGYYRFDDVTKKVSKPIFNSGYSSGNYSPEDFGTEIYSFCYSAPWNKFYLRSFVVKTDLRFKDAVKCNDTFFSRLVFPLARRITLLNKRYVYYRVNNSQSIQGNLSSGIICFAKAAVDIKWELVRRNLYQGDLRKACILEATDLINNGFLKTAPLANPDIAKLLYSYCKENALSELFDDPQEIPPNSCAYHIYLSHSFEEFLMCLIADYRENYFPKDSWRFRIGNFVCTSLGRLKQLFRG